MKYLMILCVHPLKLVIEDEENGCIDSDWMDVRDGVELQILENVNNSSFLKHFDDPLDELEISTRATDNDGNESGLLAPIFQNLPKLC